MLLVLLALTATAQQQQPHRHLDVATSQSPDIAESAFDLAIEAATSDSAFDKIIASEAAQQISSDLHNGDGLLKSSLLHTGLIHELAANASGSKAEEHEMSQDLKAAETKLLGQFSCTAPLFAKCHIVYIFSSCP
jgi:hypothetical protein